VKAATALLLACIPACAQAPIDLPVFKTSHFGNSQTDVITNALGSLALGAGITNLDMHKITQPGICVGTLLDNGRVQTEVSTTVPDAIVMENYCDMAAETTYAVRLATMAYQANPQCQIYFYSVWPYGPHNWDAPPEYRTEVPAESCLAVVKRHFPTNPTPRIIPASLLFRELGKMADRGELPNVASHFQLLADGTHPSNMGYYADNMLTLAILYGITPDSFPTTLYKLTWDNKLSTELYFSIPDTTARIMKQVAWDVMTTYPYTGINGGFLISDRSLKPAVAGTAYACTLHTRNAPGSVTWSLKSGTLPTGLALSAAGVFSGATAQTGAFALVIRAVSGSATATRPLTLSSYANTPPSITAPSPATVALDQYVFVPLTVTGGIGSPTWSLVSGALPKNMTLSAGGTLFGTAGEAGSFAFTVSAIDNNPAGAQSSQKQLTWQIGEAASNPLMVCKTIGSFTVDGLFNEPEWASARWQPIAKSVAGSCTKSAEFALVWHRTGTTEGEMMLGVKVVNGAAGKTPLDAIEIYVDALHNQELAYNINDKHYAACRDQTVSKFRGCDVLNRVWWMSGAVRETADGFTVEWPVDDAYFYGQPSVSLAEYGGLGGGTVYGFDIAVDEGSTEGTLARSVWRGSAADDVNPSAFGSILTIDFPIPAAPVDSLASRIWRDGDFKRFLPIAWNFQVDTSKLFVWYSPGSGRVDTMGGNPGAFMNIGQWEQYVFASVPAARASSEVWSVSFDRRQTQAYSQSTFRAYGYHMHDLLSSGGSDKFGNGTKLAEQNLATTAGAWTATSASVTVPPGYDIVTFAWFMNSGDVNVGLDNFQIQRISTSVASPSAARATWRVASFAGGLRVAVSAERVHLTVDIFDLRGAHLARLANGQFPAGVYTFQPGRQARTVATGHYLARVAIDGAVRFVPVGIGW
jgi:hypothetical protein